MVEEIAQETVEVHAAKLLGDDCCGRHVRERAPERRLVPRGDERLLHTYLELRENVAHAIGILEDGLCPNLAGNARERIDLLGERSRRDEQYRAGELPIRLLENLRGKGEKAEVGAYEAVEFGGSVLRCGKLLHEAAKHLHIGELGITHVGKVEVGERVGQSARGDAVAEAGDGRSVVERAGGIRASVADVLHVEARELRAILGRVLGFLLAA